MWAFPENRRADAYAGRTLSDGHFKIMGHAHGELGQVDARDVAHRHEITQLAKLAKVRACFLRIVTKWRNGHQSANAKMRPFNGSRENGFELLQVDTYAALGLFATSVDLDENV